MIQIPLSIGELWDKISILEIKSSFIKDETKLRNVNKELELLREVAPIIDINLYISLIDINKQLWKVEDDIRIKENKQEFDDEFISLARSVYKMNDKRAAIKYTINKEYGSDLIEEKSYE